MTLGYFTVAILCGISFTAPLMILLATGHWGYRYANQFLLSLLALSCVLAILVAISQEYGGPIHLELLALFDLQLLFGPLLYFYARALTDTDFQMRAAQYWHFLLPPVAMLIWFAQLPLEETDWLVIPCSEESGCSLMTRARFLHRVAGYLSIATYTYFALQRLRPFREKIRATHSSIEDLELNWLRWLLVFFLGAACLGVVAEIQFFALGEFLLSPGKVIALFPLLISVLLGVFGTKQRAIHFEMEVEPKPQQDKPTAQKKYQTSSLGQDDAALLWQRLQQLMTEGRPYLENGLKISDLAKRLDVSVSHLSETINGHAGQSFYEFINSHRVEEAARILSTPDLDYLSISDIGYQSGFNSNSAFFEHFKKLKKLTPNQYRKQIRAI